MIRRLAPGEPLPAGTPRRYKNRAGYVRLRWKVGKDEYLETYEHRVVDATVTTAPHVHHRNHIRDDNNPSNLEPITEREHARRHRVLDHDLICDLYRAGRTTTAISSVVGCNSATVSRILAASGVRARTQSDYGPQRTIAELRAAHASSTSAVMLADLLGVAVKTARRLMRENGLQPWPAGRPRTTLVSNSSVR